MNEERTLKLLAAGLSHSQVASIIGASPGLISQFVKREDVQLKLTALQLETQKEQTEESALDVKYLGLEHKIIRGLEDALSNGDVKDHVMALRAITERNFRKQTSPAAGNNANPTNSGTHIINNTVLLAIPPQVAPELILNSQNQVTAINDRSIAPMPAAGVLNLFKSLRGEKNVSEGIPFQTITASAASV